jgi:DNA repair protein RecO (recombination protein O)
MLELRVTALLLRAIPYSETSAVLHVFTLERGRMALMARGLRRKGSRLAPLLQVGHLLELQILEKEGRDLQLLKDADLLDAFAGARERYTAMLCRSAVLESLERSLLDGQPEASLFSAARHVLELGAHPDCPRPQNLIYWFLLCLLSQSGYGLSLGECASCRQDVAGFWQEPGSRLDHVQGQLICPACSSGAGSDEITPALIRVLRFLNRAAPEEVAGREITRDTRRALGHLLGGLFREHVNANADLLSLKEADGLKDE